MIKPFKTTSDLDIASQIFDGVVNITHEYGESSAQDVRQSLADILRDYENMLVEVEQLTEMELHIEKLEAMLDRRKARYKRWEDG